jgi:hypothetical protein
MGRYTTDPPRPGVPARLVPCPMCGASRELPRDASGQPALAECIPCDLLFDSGRPTAVAPDPAEGDSMPINVNRTMSRPLRRIASPLRAGPS